MYRQTLRTGAATGSNSSARASSLFTRRGNQIINDTNNSTLESFAAAFNRAEEEVAPPNPVRDVPPLSIHVANAAVNETMDNMDQAANEEQTANGNETTATANALDPNPQSVRVPNERLAEIRANFTIQGIRGNTRSKKTFEAHQRNNERLILFLYNGVGESGEIGQYATMLTDELAIVLMTLKPIQIIHLSLQAIANTAKARGRRPCSREKMSTWRDYYVQRYLLFWDHQEPHLHAKQSSLMHLLHLPIHLQCS